MSFGPSDCVGIPPGMGAEIVEEIMLTRAVLLDEMELDGFKSPGVLLTRGEKVVIKLPLMLFVVLLLMSHDSEMETGKTKSVYRVLQAQTNQLKPTQKNCSDPGNVWLTQTVVARFKLFIPNLNVQP